MDKQLEVLWAEIKKDSVSEQSKGAKDPGPVKPYAGGEKIKLPAYEDIRDNLKSDNIIDLIKNRRSRRNYQEDYTINLEELSYILWASHGFDEYVGDRIIGSAPTGGGRNPFDTYIIVRNIEGLKPGYYRYMRVENALELIALSEDINEDILEMTPVFNFGVRSSFMLVWVADYYRSSYRYPDIFAQLILLEVGHICQNAYLAAESLKLGCCAIGAFDKEATVKYLKLDNEKEIPIYMATIGKEKS